MKLLLHNYFRIFVLVSHTLFAYKSFANGQAEWIRDGDKLNYKIIEVTLYGGSSTSSLSCKGRNACWVEMVKGREPYDPVLWREEIPYSKGDIRQIQVLIHDYNTYSLPKSGVINNYKDECIVMNLRGGAPLGSQLARLALIGDSCSGSITPIPPPGPLPAECTLNGDILLNHGVLQEDKVNGNTVNTMVRISCTRDTTVSIKMNTPDGGKKITLSNDNSLASELSINGTSGVAKIDVSGTSGATVVFSSKLVVSGNLAAGDFSGTAVATLDIM